LKEENISKATDELREPETSRLIGLIAHLAYWNVFGQFNKLPLDIYHRKQLFISIAEIKTSWEKKYIKGSQRRLFFTFIMPMIMLAIRMEVEVIFKNSYPKFFSREIQERIAMKLINDLITMLIDPNIFYSRFSFFESSREAIGIKQEVSSFPPPSSSIRPLLTHLLLSESKSVIHVVQSEQVLHSKRSDAAAHPQSERGKN
jgi:hypothetical protein